MQTKRWMQYYGFHCQVLVDDIATNLLDLVCELIFTVTQSSFPFAHVHKARQCPSCPKIVPLGVNGFTYSHELRRWRHGYPERLSGPKCHLTSFILFVSHWHTYLWFTRCVGSPNLVVCASMMSFCKQLRCYKNVLPSFFFFISTVLLSKQ